MNYQPVVTGNQPNSSAGIPENLTAGTSGKEADPVQQYVLLPLFSAKTKKHDEKSTREAKGKCLIELSIGVRDLSDYLKIFLITTLTGLMLPVLQLLLFRPNSSNNTNTFSVAGPSNPAVSLTLGLDEKYSYVDPSQYPDDPDIPALEDIPYSDDEEVVDAEVDFSNLETHITISPIPTTRVHKDNHVTQIIGDLSSAPQTRSIARMVKEKNPREYTKHSKILVGFKLCRRSFFNSRCKRFGYLWIYLRVKEL
nr:hypothetical protein [Tanacetum cinerariifolium]